MEITKDNATQLVADSEFPRGGANPRKGAPTYDLARF